MRQRFHRALAVCLLGSVALSTSRALAGTSATDGITVAGMAQVKGKPTEVDIGAMVVGEAELTNDAMVKYRDARKRGLAAVEGLKIPDLTIESNGVSVNQALDPNQAQQMMQGRAGVAAAKPKVQASESMKVTLKGIDKMASDKLLDTIMKVIDTGRDAGLQIGPPTPQNYYQYQMAMQSGQGQAMLVFKIGDSTTQRDLAYKQAMEDAKSKAQKLAQLAGVKLGGIMSVHESSSPKPGSMNPWAAAAAAANSDDDPTDLTSQVLADITVKVTLTVQFEIVK
jgi:uncharacterized protein YggE